MVGITNAGVGHTAGTLNGVHVESRGGRGVIVGSGARGHRDSLFPSWYGYTPSIPKKGYATGTPGANSGWATVGEAGLERVRFRGGERVDPLRELVGSGGGTTVQVQVDIDARGATPAAVDKLHREFPDTLRVALAQGVGKKP
jgi:SLT domain-containing protein